MLYLLKHAPLRSFSIFYEHFFVKVQCGNCWFEFPDNHEFIFHSQILDQTKYFCTICNIKFSTKCQAYGHSKECVNHIATICEAKESEAPQFLCKICPRYYKYEHDLIKHQIRKHSISKDGQNTVPKEFETNKTNQNLNFQILDKNEDLSDVKIEIKEEWNQNDFVSSNNC